MLIYHKLYTSQDSRYFRKYWSKRFGNHGTLNQTPKFASLAQHAHPNLSSHIMLIDISVRISNIHLSHPLDVENCASISIYTMMTEYGSTAI